MQASDNRVPIPVPYIGPAAADPVVDGFDGGTSNVHSPDDGLIIVVDIVVRPRNEIPAQIDAFKHITRDRFLELYGASEADLNAVLDFARQHGITDFETDWKRRTVALCGRAVDFAEMFNIRLIQQKDGDDPPYLGYSGIATLPANFKDIVCAVLGLPERIAAPLFKTMIPPTNQPALRVSNGAFNNYGEVVARKTLATPAALETFYKFPDGDGSTQHIGIIELDGGYRKQDVEGYFKSLGVEPSVHNILVPCPKKNNGERFPDMRDGKNRQPELSTVVKFAQWMNGNDSFEKDGKAYFEVTMDVSMIGALAPEADVQVYFGAQATPREFLRALEEALLIHDPQPDVLSISWSWQERALLKDIGNLAVANRINELFLAAAHMGVTICCSSGDWGASNRSGVVGVGFDVNFPASSPYVLACGGTTITQDEKEVVWNADFPALAKTNKAYLGHRKHGASGGGYSRLFRQPAWQLGITDSRGSVETTMRGLPDVAAVADPQCGLECLIANDGKTVVTFPTGGTSAAAPMWAALVARLNQKLGCRVGCLTPILYDYWKQRGNTLKDVAVFNDVAQGDNCFGDEVDLPTERGMIGFRAVPDSWDPCKGLGTPNGEGLLALLQTRLAEYKAKSGEA